jgi:hypothetical protein
MKKILLLFCIAPLLATAQNEDSLFIKKISNEMLLHGKAYDLLYDLTKHIGGRLAGSPQFAKAINWGYHTMQSMGADSAYLQECMVPHWVRGGKDVASVTYSNGDEKTTLPLAVTALGNSQGTGVKGLTAPIIEVHTFAELEQKKNDVKGKIVFYNCSFDDTLIQPFQAYSKYATYRVTGPSRAAKYGAVATLTRSMTNSPDNIPHTGAMIYNDTFPKIPAAAMGLQDVVALSKLFAKDPSLTVTLTTNGKMLPDTIGDNVIGELIGTMYPNEYITVGGHLDSWDLAEGAHDDGTGVVQTLEVLRTLKALGYHPKHTIRFVLFANEENGTRGAKKYAEVAKQKNEHHIFALESDEGGFTPRGFSFTMSKEKIQAIQSWLPLFRPYGVAFLSEGGGGSDIGPLNGTFNTPLAGLSPDGQRYFDYHHARNDVFENVNKRELLLGAINMAALVYLVDTHGL